MKYVDPNDKKHEQIQHKRVKFLTRTLDNMAQPTFDYDECCKKDI